MRERLTQLLDGITSGALDESEAVAESRELQDAIYVRRQSAPFVFEWVYAKDRDASEDQMQEGAEELVQ